MTWKNKLDVSSFFHSDDLTITQKGEKIAEAVKAYPWFNELYYKDDLEGLLEELSEVEDADDFDFIWDQIYDIFDAERVWVQTR